MLWNYESVHVGPLNPTLLTALCVFVALSTHELHLSPHRKYHTIYTATALCNLTAAILHTCKNAFGA